MKKNNVRFEICNKIISNKPVKINYCNYGISIGESSQEEKTKDTKIISYQEFKEKYPYRFNVLVADCEGCLEYFLEMMGNDI